MTTEALHPDHLQPGDRVGPWLIVQVLGRGGTSRVFKVERDGLVYALKMALRPLSPNGQAGRTEEENLDEVNVYRRLAREAAALFSYSSHPNLLRVYAVDFWPHPSNGYPFLVIDFVEGDTWHEWRWRKPLHAAELVDTYGEVVRTVGVLHARGVYHRDLKADNLLIRRADGRPFLIDFGTVRLPGALSVTLGIPEGALHLLPPELLAYMRTEAWRQGLPFQGGVSADLYALGVLLYQALTDKHPFDPKLPDRELLAIIAHSPPVAPPLLNPLVPRSLGDIAMKLLEKRPEDRYPTTEALLHALEHCAERERQSSAWRVPLTPPERPDTDRQEEGTKPVLQPPEKSSGGETRPPEQAPPRDEVPPDSTPSTAHEVKRRTWLILAVLAGMLAVGAIGARSWRATLAPLRAKGGTSMTAQKEIPPVPALTPESTPSSRGISFSLLLTVGLCAATNLGCPAAQVRPTPGDCPEEAIHNTFEVLKVTDEWMESTYVMLDINQPGNEDYDGIYREGPIVGRVLDGPNKPPPTFPAGTLLYGRLWTNPGVKYAGKGSSDAIMGRYTEALLLDGRKLPICLVIGPRDGVVVRIPGPQPGTVFIRRAQPVSPVRVWP